MAVGEFSGDKVEGKPDNHHWFNKADEKFNVQKSAVIFVV